MYGLNQAVYHLLFVGVQRYQGQRFGSLCLCKRCDVDHIEVYIDIPHERWGDYYRVDIKIMAQLGQYAYYVVKTEAYECSGGYDAFFEIYFQMKLSLESDYHHQSVDAHGFVDHGESVVGSYVGEHHLVVKQGALGSEIAQSGQLGEREGHILRLLE